MRTLSRHWLAEATHELRAPLAVMQALVEAMQDRYREPDERTLSLLHREIRSLDHLIDDLHWLACYDAGRPPEPPQPVDLTRLVEDTAHAYAGRFRAAELKLEVDVRGPFTVLGDRHDLRRLLVNLLENSLSYTDPGGCCRVEVRPGRLRLDDTSPGVPEALLGRLGERFFQAAPRRGRGSGLGLAICRGIAERHQGSLTMEASPFGGLRVTCSTPG